MCFFPAIFVETTPLPLRNHFVITPLPSNTFPVPCCYYCTLSPFSFVFALQCSIAFFKQKQSFSLIFIYFYRDHRARIFVQIFIAVTFSTQKFAHLQIFHYLCNRILRWREICPAKSVSQWVFLG